MSERSSKPTPTVQNWRRPQERDWSARSPRRIATRGRAFIVLTGGGTGIALLRHVADYGVDIDWSAVHLFWGDDRYVPHDDDERNDKQVRDALLERIVIPAGNVHAMAAADGEFGADIDAAALAYERLLADVADDGEPTPEFDVHLLGMGGEGHINSLFPDTAAVREQTRLVIAVTDSPKPPPRTDHVDAARGSTLARSLAGGRRCRRRPRRSRPRSAARTPWTFPRPVRSGGRRRCGCSTGRRPPYSTDDDDVQGPRTVHALHPVEFDVAGRARATDPGQRPCVAA